MAFDARHEPPRAARSARSPLYFIWGLCGRPCEGARRHAARDENVVSQARRCGGIVVARIWRPRSPWFWRALCWRRRGPPLMGVKGSLLLHHLLLLHRHLPSRGRRAHRGSPRRAAL